MIPLISFERRQPMRSQEFNDNFRAIIDALGGLVRLPWNLWGPGGRLGATKTGWAVEGQLSVERLTLTGCDVYIGGTAPPDAAVGSVWIRPGTSKKSPTKTLVLTTEGWL